MANKMTREEFITFWLDGCGGMRKHRGPLGPLNTDKEGDEGALASWGMQVTECDCGESDCRGWQTTTTERDVTRMAVAAGISPKLLTPKQREMLVEKAEAETEKILQDGGIRRSVRRFACLTPIAQQIARAKKADDEQT